jgi:hypothetical protein
MQDEVRFLIGVKEEQWWWVAFPTRYQLFDGGYVRYAPKALSLTEQIHPSGIY